MQCTGDLLEGTVTSVNSSFAYFEVESTIRVHMSVRLAQVKSQKLPLLGSKVVIKKGHTSGSIFITCKSSTVKGNFLTVCPQSPFLNLIALYKLGARDIFKFEEIRKEVENNFTNLEEMKMDILQSLLQNIIFLALRQRSVTHKKENCSNTVISNFSLTTVRTCKHIEIKSNKFCNFPYWSFGAHPSKKNLMLFGYLEIQPIYGFYMIKDKHYQIVCIVITKDSIKTDLEIFQLRNSYVLIEKYTVITEIFNESGTPNIEYIVANVDDINMIYSARENDSMFGIEPKEHYHKVISFILLKKSTVCVTANNIPELLLHVFIRVDDTRVTWQEVYFVLPSMYVSMNLYFKEGSLYMLYYNTPLQEVTHPELIRIKNLKVYEVADRGCYFEPVHIGLYKPSDLLGVPECKFYIENASNLVSFRGIIRSKRFTNPLSSRTANKSTVYGFGTPGWKVHQIVFSHFDDNSTVFLDCYLNNWENMLMPLGLVPNMEVIVKHVYPQSKKYLKSSTFTTFEVVSYKPLIRFNTVNLYINEDINWGIPSFLSQGHKMPAGVLVWGEVFSIFMLKFMIISRCIRCKQSINDADHGNACNETQREIEFMAKFNTLDQHGQSSVTTNSLQVLRALFNLKPTNLEEWIQTFYHIGTYHYNYFDGINPTDTPLSSYITNYFGKVKEKRVFLDLKCRKLETSRLLAQQRPFWHCIDARRR